jgi:hypothetical protein
MPEVVSLTRISHVLWVWVCMFAHNTSQAPYRDKFEVGYHIHEELDHIKQKVSQEKQGGRHNQQTTYYPASLLAISILIAILITVTSPPLYPYPSVLHLPCLLFPQILPTSLRSPISSTSSSSQSLSECHSSSVWACLRVRDQAPSTTAGRDELLTFVCPGGEEACGIPSNVHC